MSLYVNTAHFLPILVGISYPYLLFISQLCFYFFIFFFSLYSQSTKICLMLPPYNLEIPGILCHNLYWCCLKFHVLPAKSNSYKTEVSSTLHCLVFFFFGFLTGLFTTAETYRKHKGGVLSYLLVFQRNLSCQFEMLLKSELIGWCI